MYFKISQEYLDTTQKYYVRVCLVTIEHEKTRQRYIHPYKLEDIENNVYNNSRDHAVYYPIVEQDNAGIKTFPNLRIVKIKADALKNSELHVFNSPSKYFFLSNLKHKSFIFMSIKIHHHVSNYLLQKIQSKNIILEDFN